MAHPQQLNQVQDDRPSSPPSLTHTSFNSDSDDAAARTLMTPSSMSHREARDYAGIHDPRGRAPLIPKAGVEPKTPTRSTWSKRDAALPPYASAPTTPTKEKRKSKRFTFGRQRTPQEEAPPLPTLDKVQAEKSPRKNKRLSVSQSLQNLHDRARSDRSRRRASTVSERAVPQLCSDLPPVPAIPSMYKTAGTNVTPAPPAPAPGPRSMRDANDRGFSKIEPQSSGFKKFMRRMTLQKPPKQYPSEPASTFISGPPRTPVPPAPKVAAAGPFVGDSSPTPSPRFGSLGRKQSKKRGSLVPQIRPPKSVKGVLAEMSQSSIQVQRRATYRRSQIQRIPVPTWAADEFEPMITGNEKPAPPQTEVNANDASVAQARADALARLMGTKSGPTPSEADLEALPPLNQPLRGPIGHTRDVITSPVEEPPVSNASARPRAPVPPLRTNSPRSATSTPKSKHSDVVTPPPEAMDVFTPPPPLPTGAEQLAKAPVPQSPVCVSTQSSPMKRILIMDTPDRTRRAGTAPLQAPSSFRSPLPDEFIQPRSAPAGSCPPPPFRTAPLKIKRRSSPEPMDFSLPPGAGSPLSNGANLSDAAAIAASYRSRATTPDRMQRNPSTRSLGQGDLRPRRDSLPTRKPMRSVTDPTTSRPDLGHGHSQCHDNDHGWTSSPSQLRHARSQPTLREPLTPPTPRVPPMPRHFKFRKAASDMGHGHGHEKSKARGFRSAQGHGNLDSDSDDSSSLEPSFLGHGSDAGYSPGSPYSPGWSSEGPGTGSGTRSRFRSITRSMRRKPVVDPDSFEAFEIKQREILTRRKSCKPVVYSKASIAAGIGRVGDKEDARVMEACFMS